MDGAGQQCVPGTAAHSVGGCRDPRYQSSVPRRLIADRRIEFVKLGRHVLGICVSVLDDFIASGVVLAPITTRNYQQGKVA